MSTISVSRSNVTADEVSEVLKRTLGAHYKVTRPTSAADSGATRPGESATILVASGWFARASVRITPDTNGTEIHVTPGAVYGLVGILLGSGLVRKVSKTLEGAPELGAAG